MLSYMNQTTATDNLFILNSLIWIFLTSELAEKVECSVLFINKDWDPAVSSEDFFTPLVPQVESKWTDNAHRNSSNIKL